MQNKFWCLLLIGFIVSSCDSNRIFDEYKTVPNEWNKNNIISFSFKPQDSLKQYNLFVNIRNNNTYKYSNLFLLVELNYPNGKTTKDTLEYVMAKPNGKLLGEGFSDIKENKLWFKENFIFSEDGTYQINIQHAMRKNGNVKGIENLEGITDVGFRVEQTTSVN
jgi:gliding motility-associated lipoprotein GldH